MKKIKQIKSFTVNGDVYNWLVEKIKQTESDLSISSLVDDYLGYLYYELKSILDYYEQQKIHVDLSWVVNKIVEDTKFFPPKLNILYADPDMKRFMEGEIHSKAMHILEEYQKEQKLIMKNIWERQKKRDFEIREGKKGVDKLSKKPKGKNELG